MTDKKKPVTLKVKGGANIMDRKEPQPEQLNPKRAVTYHFCVMCQGEPDEQGLRGIHYFDGVMQVAGNLLNQSEYMQLKGSIAGHMTPPRRGGEITLLSLTQV